MESYQLCVAWKSADDVPVAPRAGSGLDAAHGLQRRS